MLVTGANVLAIQGHNVSLTSTDLSLIPTLQASNPPPTAPAGPDSPANGATGVSANPSLCVTVHDLNADTMSVTFKGREATPSGDNFTIVVLPDSQYYASAYPSTYTAQTQWIVDNRVARNIVYVSGVPPA